MKITVQQQVAADINTVWQSYTQAQHIVKWNAASDDWHCPEAEVDLRVGGRFRSRMAAKDGSMSFDFEGSYTRVDAHQALSYQMDDGRVAEIQFESNATGTLVSVVFDAETLHPIDMQQQGWQAILDRFADYTAQISGDAE